nr:type VI secretion system Vgr family protein [uncultured Caldimonas sp.]
MLDHRAMAASAIQDLARALGVSFTAETRLYELQGSELLAGLLVESFSAREALSELFDYRVTVLSTSAHVDLAALLGEQASLAISLADGSRTTRTGVIVAASALQSDGGLARYELVVQPWLSALALTQRSQSFIDKTVIEIVESIFQPYASIAAWAWSPCVSQHLASVAARHYCNQFRETDLSFVSRLLAEEGIGWRFEEDESAPKGHKLIFFADSPALPEDASSAAGGGIRYHRASSQEDSDAVQAFTQAHRLRPAVATLQAWDYAAKRSYTASVPTRELNGTAPRLEHYDPAGSLDHHAGTSSFQAGHYARVLMESLEAWHQRHEGLSTVRTLRPGTRFSLREAPLPQGQSSFLATALTSAGINNLPKDLNDAIARRLGPAGFTHELPEEVKTQAQASGYGNHFTCLAESLPWRPRLQDDTGTRLNPKPRVLGPQSALVVGPNGETSPSGAEEIHTDRWGRIRVQFHWQAHASHANASNHSIWVRMAQPYAGAGMGSQFIPRIGQEVLVHFEDLDIDRPIAIGAFYNGRGEAGIPATPGGLAAEADLDALTQSTDHRTSAQGNLASGHSPAWHGAAPGPDHQANAAALSGFKTKEFGGDGYSQLVFDDTDAQLRVQAKTTQYETHLNLGHLLHQADNHRGSFRGLGLELRTDAYGAVRGGKGVLLSTYGIPAATPAGDNAPGMALAKQMVQLAQTFSDAAKTHETVQLAGHIGSHKAGQSAIDDKAAPLKALHTALSGTVAERGFDTAQEDAANKHTQASDDKLPHTTDPVVAITAKAGFGLTAGQDIHIAAGETIHTASGQDTHHAIGGQARLHTGQAIGVLAGAIGPGEGAAGKGLTMIAAQGNVDVQAQAGPMQVAAKGLINIKSKASHIDWAAAKKIVLATEGGASITIDASGIVTQCPGKITVHAGRKSFVGPGAEDYPVPPLPRSVLKLCLMNSAAAGDSVTAKV